MADRLRVDPVSDLVVLAAGQARSGNRRLDW
jgi:hypothetical protein